MFPGSSSVAIIQCWLWGHEVLGGRETGDPSRDVPYASRAPSRLLWVAAHQARRLFTCRRAAKCPPPRSRVVPRTCFHSMRRVNLWLEDPGSFMSVAWAGCAAAAEETPHLGNWLFAPLGACAWCLPLWLPSYYTPQALEGFSLKPTKQLNSVAKHTSGTTGWGLQRQLTKAQQPAMRDLSMTRLTET